MNKNLDFQNAILKHENDYLIYVFNDLTKFYGRVEAFVHADELDSGTAVFIVRNFTDSESIEIPVINNNVKKVTLTDGTLVWSSEGHALGFLFQTNSMSP